LAALGKILNMSVLAITEKVGDIAKSKDLSGFIVFAEIDPAYRKIADPEDYQILWLENGVKSIDIDFEVRESFPLSASFLFIPAEK
jgi:hypothetical protein